MAPKVFIDGEAGTTGLQIADRLADREDLDVISIDPDLRKDNGERRRMINEADVAILCLPDAAAKEAVALSEGADTVIIDASSAHRVSAGWTYGFPEMDSAQRDAIRASKRISNPGCYPTGFIALARPLVKAGILQPDFPITVNAVSGYTGGGKGLINEYEAEAPEHGRDSLRTYGLSFAHKHLPEMTAYAGLDHAPLFAPSVGRFAQGMIVEIPLQLWALNGDSTVGSLREVLLATYENEAFVSVATVEEDAELQAKRAGAAGYVEEMDPAYLAGGNQLKLHVFGSDKARQARLVAILDNLGKGASGAAVQNLNIALGFSETAGL